MDKNVMFKITYGLFVLTAKEDDKLNGCIVNTVMQQTSEPNRVSVTVNKQNYTEGMIRRTGKINASLIDESADFSLFKHFGFQSGRDVDKFADFSDYALSANGLPYINKGTCGYISMTVEQSIDLGSHTLFIASVDDGEVLSENSPMSYSFYHANVKPKKDAPAKAEGGSKVWVCEICGYTYDEAAEGVPFEELPDDWTCPWCKHGKEYFKLQEAN